MADECSDCGATFGSPAELVVHMKKAHNGGSPAETLAMNPASSTPTLECALCGQTFWTKEALAEHNQRPHRGPGFPQRSRATPA